MRRRGASIVRPIPEGVPEPLCIYSKKFTIWIRWHPEPDVSQITQGVPPVQSHGVIWPRNRRRTPSSERRVSTPRRRGRAATRSRTSSRTATAWWSNAGAVERQVASSGPRRTSTAWWWCRSALRRRRGQRDQISTSPRRHRRDSRVIANASGPVVATTPLQLESHRARQSSGVLYGFNKSPCTSCRKLRRRVVMQSQAMGMGHL